MLGRLGLSIALIISGGLLLGAPVAAADDGSGDLQPIVSGLPRAALPTSPDTDVVVAGRRVSAIPTLVRVDAPAAHAASDPAETTVLAYSMDLDSRAFAASTQWTATSIQTPGIRGVRSSSWIAKRAGAVPADPMRQARELAARQIAVWHYTNGFEVTAASVPDPKVRHRALRLIRLASDAPSNVQVSPTSLSLSAKVSDVETDTVSIATLLSTNGENSFCDAQKLDVRLFGGWGTIQTGKVTGLSRVAPGRYKAIPEGNLEGQPCSKGASAIDYDSALFTFPRPTQGTTLEVDWNLTLNGISVFQASDGSAPLIIAGNPSLEFRQTVAIDPGAFPTADTYLQRFITSLLHWFHGVVAIIVLLVLLYLAPWFKRGVDAALTGTGRIIKRRFQQKPPQTTAENASSGDD